MPLRFRNLTISPDDPVATWPAEAVQTALERGDLADWQRIVRELEREPWGRAARRLEEVLSRQSGLSRSEFAAQLGTSASRLSTYPNGKVMPSAALMVRIRRLLPTVRDYGQSAD